MNIVVIGCGLIASRWIRTLTADPRVKIAALVDPDRDRAVRLAAKYDLALDPHPRLSDALNDGPLDVAVNLTPPSLHATVSTEALRAGLHVLTEKPLATSYTDALRLAELAGEQDRLLAVMDNRGRETQAFADLARSGGDGPKLVCADVFVGLPDPGFRTRLPLPATIDLAPHAFDQIGRLIAAAPERVHCTEAALPWRPEHCTIATIVIDYADGSHLTWRGGFTDTTWRTPATGHWRIDQNGSTLSWHGTDTATVTSDGRTPAVHHLPEQAPGYRHAIGAMLDAACGPGPYPVPDLAPIALLDAALAAVTLGRPQTVHREGARL
jgi:predicted dehydrogenase